MTTLSFGRSARLLGVHVHCPLPLTPSPRPCGSCFENRSGIRSHHSPPYDSGCLLPDAYVCVSELSPVPLVSSQSAPLKLCQITSVRSSKPAVLPSPLHLGVKAGTETCAHSASSHTSLQPALLSTLLTLAHEASATRPVPSGWAPPSLLPTCLGAGSRPHQMFTAFA